MKRLLLLLVAASALVACDTGVISGGDETIILTGGTQTSQIYGADAATKANVVKFKATAEWTAEVKEVSATKASEVSWLELDAYNGKPGDNVLSLTLLANETGSSRKAAISIVVDGETKVTINVEQKAEKEPVDKNMRYVKKLVNYGGDFPLTFTYTYDQSNRVIKIESNEITSTFTYSGNSIFEKIKSSKGGISNAEYTLGSNGYVVKDVVSTGEDNYTYNDGGYLTRSIYKYNSGESYRQNDYTWSESQIKWKHTRDSELEYTEIMTFGATYNNNTNFNYLMFGEESNLGGLDYFGKSPAKLVTESVGTESYAGVETTFKYRIRFELDDHGCIKKMYTQHLVYDEPTPSSSFSSRTEEWDKENLIFEIEYY